MQGFEGKKERFMHLLSHFLILCVYAEFPLIAIGTRARFRFKPDRDGWKLHDACVYHSTTPDTTLTYQNAVFKLNV